MKTIIYIHGFNSEPSEKTKQLLAEAVPDADVIIPKLPYQPRDAIGILDKILHQARHGQIHIIGKSLGAFYGLWLNERYKTSENILLYMVNPLIEGYNFFKSMEGETVTNFYDKTRKFTIDKTFIEKIKEYENDIFSTFDNISVSNINFFIGTFDTVIDNNILKKKLSSLKCPFLINETKQDHRYQNLDAVIYKLKLNQTIFNV